MKPLALLYLLLALALTACGRSENDAAPASDTTAGTAASPAEPLQRAHDDDSLLAGAQLSGIDVSHYQGDVDWQEVADAGIDFAIVKATEGAGTVDPRFAANWQGLKAAGLPRGVYHFFEPADDPAAQARHFLATVTLEPGDLPPVLDVEKALQQRSQNPTTEREALIRDIRTWLQEVERSVGHRPIIYTSRTYWDQHMDDSFSDYPLWVARYGVARPGALPQGWQRWTFWQHSDRSRVDGVSGDDDTDLFNGTPEDLHALTIR